MPRYSIRKKQTKKAVLYRLIPLIFAVSAICVFYIQKNEIEGQPSINVLHEDIEKRPNDKYTAGPLIPNKLFIKRAGVNTRVIPIGVDHDNKLQSPGNIHDAGWYRNSAKPGDLNGALLIDGHVSGPTKSGVFYNLKNLNQGDEIMLERGDGKKYEFVVRKTAVYEEEATPMKHVLQSVASNRLGLNLITCAGEFNQKENKYQDRLVIFSVLK